MEFSKIQDEINEINYWDSKLLDFSTNFFGDETRLILSNDEKTDYILECYFSKKVEYITDADERWGGLKVKDMNKCQLPFYFHDILVSESSDNGFIEINFDINPLIIKIICKGIKITKISHSENDYFWSKNS